MDAHARWRRHGSSDAVTALSDRHRRRRLPSPGRRPPPLDLVAFLREGVTTFGEHPRDSIHIPGPALDLADADVFAEALGVEAVLVMPEGSGIVVTRTT